MKKLFSILFVLLGVVSAVLPSASFAKSIGTVDNLKVMRGYPYAQEAQRKIENLRGEIQKKVVEVGNQLKTNIQGAKTDAEKLKLQKDARSKISAEKARYDSIVQGINKDVEDRIMRAINAVAAEKSLDMVISKNFVYYGGVDITDSVIAKLK